LNENGGSPSEIDAAAESWTQIVKGEYLEIPGLFLTRGQVQRLWCLDEALCDRVLQSLIDTGFLKRTHDDKFARAAH
jgi:hypothetical protein